MRSVSAILIFQVLLAAIWHEGVGQHRRVNKTGTKKERNVRLGTWGGDHIRMEVTERGAAIDYDCAHGSIDKRMTLDDDGNFDLAGFHVREHHGPIRVGRELASLPARYTGRVEGQTMTLNVTLADTKQSVGTYTLVYGRTPRIVKCR